MKIIGACLQLFARRQCHIQQAFQLFYCTSAIKTERVHCRGVNFAYHTHGSGSQPLLLIPGALGSGRSDFGPQLEKLDGSKFTVVAIDPRGYGKSIPPIRDFPINFYERDAYDANFVMQALGFNKFSLIGWSDGGISAMILAAKEPELVQKLVIFGANASITSQDMELFEKTKNIDTWSERMSAPMIEMYGRESFQDMWSDWLETMHLIFNQRGGDICQNDLQHIKCPTLILHGLKDPMVALFHPDFLNKAIWGSKRIDFPEGKHNLHLRFAEEFNKVVTEFLLK